MNREEAIKIVKNHYPANKQMLNEALEFLIPELKVSEDERIRKALIKYFNVYTSYSELSDGVTAGDCVAWLEKQGEQKPTDKIHLGKEYKCIASPRYSTFIKGKIYKPEDEFLCGFMNFCSDCFEPIENSEQKDFTTNANKVEPKFKVGDWVIFNNYEYNITDGICRIEKAENYQYTLRDILGGTMYLSYSSENMLRHWSIADAKDGDVIAVDSMDGYPSPFVGIYKERDLDSFNSHCFIGFDGNFYEGEEGHTIVDIHPATKEQRDLLFTKMKEAGYEWDSEQKQCEQKPVEKFKSKFKDGDWIVYKDNVWKVCNISLHNYYELLKINNEVSTRLIEDVDENAHLWSITDAKDGDVLISSLNKPFIYNGYFHEDSVGAYCGLYINDDFVNADKERYWTNNENIRPATKGERDFLFQKMREAGYEWNGVKKKLTIL